MSTHMMCFRDSVGGGAEGDWGKQSFIVIHEFFHITSLGSKEHLHGMVAWISKEGLA